MLPEIESEQSSLDMINDTRISRRQALAGGALLAAATSFFPQTAAAANESSSKKSPFVFCLNTGTLLGHKLGIVKEIEIATQAGYQAIEPWVDAIDRYAKAGGSLNELKQRIQDAGLTVESAIGFPEWVVDDDERRAKGLERARYEMDLVLKIGGKRLAAPPSGATDKPGLDLNRAAERYRALLELGDQIGVLPQLEVWGFSQNLNRLSTCTQVAMETGHPKACVLADVFHLYKGGSRFEGLNLLSGNAIQVFHMNDYPNDPPRDKINDGYRIFPGDGIAPMDMILRTLAAQGGTKILSLEMFNKKYWEQDALEVAKTGLAKMKAAVEKAG